MGFSGVLGAASTVADGEGADDVSAEKDENSLMKSVIDQSISGKGKVELSKQNDAGEADTSEGQVVGIGNCSKLKSPNDARSSNEQEWLYPFSVD